MTITIEHKETIQGWESLLQEFFTSRGITEEEKIIKNLDGLQKNLEEKKQYAFCAFSDGMPCGFIFGKDANVTLEMNSFYIQPAKQKEKCTSKLIVALANLGFKNNFKYFRFGKATPFTKEENFEEDLKKAGFMVFPRAQMMLDLTDDLETPIFIPKDYQLVPFAKEQVNDIMEVIKAANTEGHSDYYIYPEMSDVVICREVFGSFSNDYADFDKDLNPQIAHNGKIVGMSFVMTTNPETAFIAEISVHPDHQRKGLGKALMNSIIENCRKKGIKRLRLAVTIDNSGAYQLYKKLGFKETKELLAIVKHK